MADGDITLSQNPNVDTALVEKDGKLLRAVLQETPAGTLQLSDSPNVDTGYIIDDGGNKHKVHLVATPDGTLETEGGVNSGKGYITDGDGKKHRVSLVASLTGGGVEPTGTLEITANGVYDVAEYANADVQVPGLPDVFMSWTKTGSTLNNTRTFTFPATITSIDMYALAYAFYTTSQASLNFDSITSVGAYGFFHAFDSNTNITSVSCTGITSLSSGYEFNYAFYKSNLTNFPLTNLTSVSGASSLNYAFGYSKIVNVDLSKLTSITGTDSLNQCFRYCSELKTFAADSITLLGVSNAMSSVCGACTKLESFSMKNLTSISASGGLQGCCSGCSALTSVDLSNLTSLTATNAFTGAFNNCSELESISLPKLKNITNATAFCANTTSGKTFGNCTKLKDIYFGGLTASTFGSIQSQLQYMFTTTTGSQATGGCTVHFPATFDPSDPNHTFDASTLGGYPTFGGSSSYIHIVYDL